MSDPWLEAWKREEQRIYESGLGKKARALLMEYADRYPQDSLWRTIGLEYRAFQACASAAVYHPDYDWNASQRENYKQGRASAKDVQLAIWTVLDYLDIYGPDPGIAMARVLARNPERITAPAVDDPGLTLASLLLLLSDAIPEAIDPATFSVDEAPHHYRFGPLQSPTPITLTKHLGDVRLTGLAFQLEATFRLFRQGRWLSVGDSMPEDDEGAFEVTTAFIRASIEPSATVKEIRDMLGKRLKANPGLTWADWPLPWSVMRVRQTSQIRTRRRIR